MLGESLTAQELHLPHLDRRATPWHLPHQGRRAPRPYNPAVPKDPAVWFPKLPKGRKTTKFSRTRARQLLYQDRRCEEVLVQRTMHVAMCQRRSRAARSRRPLVPPVYAARTRRPLASPSRAARSRRPLVQSPRPARLRRPLTPPARARHAVLLILHGFGGAAAGCSGWMRGVRTGGAHDHSANCPSPSMPLVYVSRSLFER